MTRDNTPSPPPPPAAAEPPSPPAPQPPLSAYEALKSELEVEKKEEAEESEDEDSYSEEEYEEEVEQLTEWFPPDLGWVRHVNHDAVIVTDVTVNDMTVTMRESKQPEGFFSYSH